MFYISLLKLYKQHKGITRDPLLGPIKLDNKGDQKDQYKVEEVYRRKGHN